MLQRFPTCKYLAVNIFLWGVVEMCHAACTNPSSILVCRFLLGLFQCCDLPAMIIIATMWWRKSEQPVRSAMVCAVTSSIGNGLISFGFGHLEHSALPKWNAKARDKVGSGPSSPWCKSFSTNKKKQRRKSSLATTES